MTYKYITLEETRTRYYTGFFDGRNARLRVIRPTSSDEVESQQTTSTSAGTDRTPDGRALSLYRHAQQAAAPYYWEKNLLGLSACSARFL